MEAHHRRLHHSAAMMEFKISFNIDALNEAAEALLKLNGLSDAYLRPIAWHGAETLSVSTLKSTVHVAIAAWKWDSYFAAGHKGIKLMWGEWIRPAPNMSPVHAKANGQYIIGTLSKNKAERLGFHDALMLDYRGYVAECTGANIFMVKNGVIYTPIADCFLNGITRQTIIELAREAHLPMIEKHLLPSEILQADEVFITGSAAEVQPVAQIGDREFDQGTITQHLMARYKSLVTGGTHA